MNVDRLGQGRAGRRVSSAAAWIVASIIGMQLGSPRALAFEPLSCLVKHANTKGMEPVTLGKGGTYRLEHGAVWVFSSLKGTRTDERVGHLWIHNGRIIDKVSGPVLYNRLFFSHKHLGRGGPGRYLVRVIDNKGAVKEEIRFDAWRESGRYVIRPYAADLVSCDEAPADYVAPTPEPTPVPVVSAPPPKEPHRVAPVVVPEEPQRTKRLRASEAIPPIVQGPDEALPVYDPARHIRVSIQLTLTRLAPGTGEELVMDLDDEHKFVARVEATRLDAMRYELKVPLRAIPLSSVLVAGDKINEPESRRPRARFNFGFIVDDRTNCVDLLVRAEKGEGIPYRLCSRLSDFEVANLGFDHEAFYFRSPSGVWGQGGLGVASQDVSGIGSSTSSIGSQRSAVFRVGVGAWYHAALIEAYFRSKFYSLSEETFRPTWLDVYGGYRLELPQFIGFTPHVALVTGAEFYSNHVTVPGVRYLRRYIGLLGGAQVRFVLGSKFEFGGDVIYGVSRGVRKVVHTEDVRYWLSKRNAIGLGAWTDSQSQPALEFAESTTAIELYWRHVLEEVWK